MWNTIAIEGEEGIIKIGRDIGKNDLYHKYIEVACKQGHPKRWIRIDKKTTNCKYCPHSPLKMTSERRENMSDAQKRRYKRDGNPPVMYRSKVGDKNPMFGKKQSIESKTKNSVAQKRNWSRLEYQKKWARSHIKPFVNQTKPEIEIESSLKRYGLEFVGNSSFWVGYPPRNPDFIHRSNKKIVEFFGNFWHKPEDEENRLSHYKKYGWDCLVVWEADFNIDKNSTIKKIKEFIQCGVI